MFSLVFDALSGFASKAFAWLTDSAWHVGIAVLVVVGIWAAVETHEADKWHKAYTQQGNAFKTAEAAADAAEQAKLSAMDAQITQNAQEAQTHETQDLARNDAAGDVYKRLHTIHPSASGNVPSAGGDTASISVGSASDAIVVSGKDFDACTADATYAMNAYLWALHLSDTFDNGAP